MGIEQYNKGRRTPGGEPSTRTGRGIKKLFEGIGSFFERKEKPKRSGVELYNQGNNKNQPKYRSFEDRIIPGADKFMTEEYVRPFGKWASETVPTSFKKWNQSYQKQDSPIEGDTSRDYKSQFGDIGKWLVNTPVTWATFGADVATDLGESSVAMLPEWAGGEGRGVFSKEQKYAFEQGMVDKFGIKPISKNNPYVKYDWEDWDGTKKSNPIIHETRENNADFMYNDFLNDHMAEGIVNDIGRENLEGKSIREQNEIFDNAFYNKYKKEWDMYYENEFNQILKDDYDIGPKGTPGAINEFELDFNYDPMIPYSTEETGFLEGSTRGLGEALAYFGGPGMFNRGRKFIPKWRKKAGIMDAAKGTKYEDASKYFDGL